MTHCPHCQQPYDIDRRHAMDRVLCVVCNGWSLVVMDADGQTRLVRCVPPKSYVRALGGDEETNDE